MYNELNELLNEDVTSDSWYDDGYLIAQDIMNQFSDNDWNILNKEILNKDIEWQKKLIYAIDNQIIKEEIDIIGIMLQVDNDELIEMCIDALRSYDNEMGKEYIKNNPQIITEVRKRSEKADGIVKKMLENFLAKFV